MTTIKYGYARVSTDRKEPGKEQTLEQQTQALKDYGVPPENIYQEKISGTINTDQGKQWLTLQSEIMEKSTTNTIELVIVDWSRLSRDGYALQEIVNKFTRKGNIAFTVLNDPKYQQFTPKNAMEAMMLAIEAFTAQQTREKIAKATKEKLDYLKEHEGLTLGRPTKLTDKDKKKIDHLTAQGLSPQKIATQLTIERTQKIPQRKKNNPQALKHAMISKTTVRRYLNNKNNTN